MKLSLELQPPLWKVLPSSHLLRSGVHVHLSGGICVFAVGERGAQITPSVCTWALKGLLNNEARAPPLEMLIHSGVGLRHLCVYKALQAILSTGC